MIDIGIITAPRLKPTVDRMIQGFKYLPSRPDKIHLFAEPNTNFRKHDFLEVHQHEDKKGCFGNFDYAYRWLLDNCDSEYILVLSDDVKFKSGWIKKALAKAQEIKDFGYIALYTPKGMASFFSDKNHIKLNRGYGQGGWGGLYLIKREVLPSILDHGFYQNHKVNYKENKQFDECMKETCLKLGIDQYYLNPSLFDHVGETSTIGHQHRSMDKGLNYGMS